MEKEIETRFLDINKDELAKKFVALGAADKGEERLEETIFHPTDGSWIGKRKFVRLRRVRGKTKLTYKENVGQTVDSAQEIELEVSDAEKCLEFLAKIPAYAEMEGPSVESLKAACGKLGLDWEKRFDGDAREVFRHYGYNLDDITVITFSELKYK